MGRSITTSRNGNIKTMSIIVRKFTSGLVTRIEGKDSPRGSAQDSLNWHFFGDHAELRRGRALLGEEQVGVGRVSGIKVARKFDGTQIPFYTYARKLLYHDLTTSTNIEVSTNLFPADVITDTTNNIGEDISIETQNSLAGNNVYISSPNSGMYKICTANPSNAVDLLQKEYRGRIRIKQSRTFLWNRKDTFGGADKTGLYLSYKDGADNVYQYTKQEVLGTGDGSTKSYSGTLAFKASNSKETCFFAVIAAPKQVGTGISAITLATGAQITSTAHGLVVGDSVVIDSVSGMTQINNMIAVVISVIDANNITVNIDSTGFTAYSSGGSISKAERFSDDRNGVLTSSDGGTGTINYATGAYAVTFFNAPYSGKNVLSQYFREDSTRASGGYGGIANFTYSGTRTNGQGNVLRQDDAGGSLQTAESLGSSEYCLHEFKTWVTTISPTDDTGSGTSNVIYRDNVGIPYHRAAKATGKGIFYPDVLGENPVIRVLDYGSFVAQVLPRSISDSLKLDQYSFNEAVMFEWADYIVLACKQGTATVNNRIFMYHKIWKSWEIHSYRVSCLEILNGALIAGDSGSNNIFKLFSGLADEEAKIENYFITNEDGLDIEGSKSVNIMRIAGLIGITQKMKVSYSIDNAPFVEILPKNYSTNNPQPLIIGNGPYVDLSTRKLIGSSTLGEEQIGGGQAQTGEIYASPYSLQFFIGTKNFDGIRLKFEATEVGYLSISEYVYVDIRRKGLRQPVKYQE